MPLASYWMRLGQFVRGHKALIVWGCALPWLVFGGLALKVLTTGRLWFDEPLLLLLHQQATPLLDKLAIVLTIIGNTWPMVGTGLALAGGLWWRGRRFDAGVFALAVGGSMLLTQVIKALVARARPELWPSIRPETTLSFPSGHAMDTAALATAVGLLLWRQRAPWPARAVAPLFALGVGWARMYLGVHYPSDVLAGWASAVGWVVGVYALARPQRPGEIPTR
ncbi:phosphatase PAP2 family protein [Hymenobacter ruricola]|uniref:Phosphatase PAP2 family protein n=1 Tax=Hymenobacter ruricola TaxID=2791023 RepID=A0ABS0HZP0_9BACT|nr:phosphatase PAP2 family protein [Hymenobacter ruricola]MBF9220165.1 phosphatase PAP2 family protein [Hymenobacter ruricola]